MKATKIALLVITAVTSYNAAAMSVSEAEAGVAAAHDHALAHHDATGTMQSDRDAMNAAGAARAQAYADARANDAQGRSEMARDAQQAAAAAQAKATADKQAANDAQTMSEARAELGNRLAAANVARTSQQHVTQTSLNTMAPGVVKESNPAGKPTGQLSPMDSRGWTMQPAIVKESDPAGSPTNQTGTPTHLDGVHVAIASPHLAAPANVSAQAAAALGKALEQANRQRTRQQVLAGGVAEVNAQIAAEQAAKDIANYGVKTNPEGHPVNIVSMTALTPSKPAQTGSINVGVGSLPGNTPVSVTINGITQVTRAAVVAKVDPSLQVSVPHVDGIISSPVVKGGQQGNDHGHSSEHGTGNGGNNAASHSHGLGGGEHVGGGSSQNGGFHGNW